jgi:mannose-6-phosphate isomerase-like protein (cupin superfamily)
MKNTKNTIKEDGFEGTLIKDNEQYTLIDNTMLQKMVVSKTILKPGQKTNGHYHDDIEEVYIFQKGYGKIKVGDKIKEVKAGDVVIIPEGDFHRVYNGSDEEVFVFIAVFNDKRKI